MPGLMGDAGVFGIRPTIATRDEHKMRTNRIVEQNFQPWFVPALQLLAAVAFRPIKRRRRFRPRGLGYV